MNVVNLQDQFSSYIYNMTISQDKTILIIRTKKIIGSECNVYHYYKLADVDDSNEKQITIGNKKYSYTTSFNLELNENRCNDHISMVVNTSLNVLIIARYIDNYKHILLETIHLSTSEVISIKISLPVDAMFALGSPELQFDEESFRLVISDSSDKLSCDNGFITILKLLTKEEITEKYEYIDDWVFSIDNILNITLDTNIISHKIVNWLNFIHIFALEEQDGKNVLKVYYKNPKSDVKKLLFFEKVLLKDIDLISILSVHFDDKDNAIITMLYVENKENYYYTVLLPYEFFDILTNDDERKNIEVTELIKTKLVNTSVFSCLVNFVVDDNLVIANNSKTVIKTI